MLGLQFSRGETQAIFNRLRGKEQRPHATTDQLVRALESCDAVDFNKVASCCAALGISSLHHLQQSNCNSTS